MAGEAVRLKVVVNGNAIIYNPKRLFSNDELVLFTIYRSTNVRITYPRDREREKNGRNAKKSICVDKNK